MLMWWKLYHRFGQNFHRPNISYQVLETKSKNEYIEYIEILNQQKNLEFSKYSEITQVLANIFFSFSCATKRLERSY